MAKRKSSSKTKYKTKLVKPKDYDELKKRSTQEVYNEKIKKEIKELEEKRKGLGPGFKNKLVGLGINKSINERRNLLNADRRAEQATRLTQQYNRQIELETSKAKLLELKKKNQVNFEGLGGTDFGNTQRKALKFEDLF